MEPTVVFDAARKLLLVSQALIPLRVVLPQAPHAVCQKEQAENSQHDGEYACQRRMFHRLYPLSDELEQCIIPLFTG